MSGDVERLAEVLARHSWRGWECSCGVHGRDVAPVGDASVEDCHLADVVQDWLAAHDAEVAARAWDEGMAQAGVDYMAGYDANVRGEPCPPPTQNPYRVAGHTPQERA